MKYQNTDRKYSLQLDWTSFDFGHVSHHKIFKKWTMYIESKLYWINQNCNSYVVRLSLLHPYNKKVCNRCLPIWIWLSITHKPLLILKNDIKWRVQTKANILLHLPWIYWLAETPQPMREQIWWSKRFACFTYAHAHSYDLKREKR